MQNPSISPNPSQHTFMKNSYLQIKSVVLATVAFAPAALFAQTAAKSTEAAAPTAPVVETATTTSTSSSWKFSVDYFKFKSEWGGMQLVKQIFSAYTYPDKKRDGDVFGGTLTFEKNKWGFDFQYHAGSDQLDLPNFETALPAAKFVDTVKFDEKSYAVNLRYKFTPTFYMSAGAYHNTLEQDYTWVAVGSTTVNSVDALSGEGSQTFGSLGVGLAGVYPIKDSSWSFAPKVELLALYGKDTTPSASGTAAASVVPGADKESTLFGYEGTGTLMLYYTSANAVTWAIEGGYKIRAFGADRSSVSSQQGLFVKMSLRKSF